MTFYDNIPPMLPMLKAYRFQRDAPAQIRDGHSEGQAFALTGGTLRLFVGSNTWIMVPGRLCWVPSNAEHGFSSNGPVHGFSVKVSNHLCHGLPDGARVLDADPLHLALLRRLVDKPADGDVVWPLLKRILINDPDDRLSLPAPRDPRLVKLAEALAHSPADDRDLTTWAKTIGMSPRSLMRRFVAETGLTFAVWRRGLRVLSAIHLMQDGKSATTAAHECGFAGSSAFSSAFRHHTGVSPSAYLKTRQ